MAENMGGAPTRPGWLVPGAAALAVLVVAAVVVGVLVWRSDEAAAVELVAATSAGADPFTESVQIGEVPVVEPPAVETIAEVVDALPVDAATGTLVATGSTPGLYGGTGEDGTCDGAALVEFLAANADKAAAWAGVLGIEPDGIERYVAGLTPVVLATDTLVTNHGFRGGRATATPSVLQAGTAVMVDAAGVPRVKCNCGNPLTPPDAIDLRDAATTGGAWDGYGAERVATVRAGSEVVEFVVCNLRTGERETRPVGSSSTEGTPPPDLDGDWTLTLSRSEIDPTPMAADEIDRACPTSALHGATMSVRGTRVTVGDLSGTLTGAPPGSPDWLTDMQRSLGGAVITLESDDGRTRIEMNVASGSGGIYGLVDTVDRNDMGTGDCRNGIAGRLGGAGGSAPTAAPTTAPPTTVAPTTVAPTTAASPAASGGPCDLASLTAVYRANGGDASDIVTVDACDGKWAMLTITVPPDMIDIGNVVEWNGSAWQGGVCQRYVDPNDWTRSDVVPMPYWGVCISG